METPERVNLGITLKRTTLTRLDCIRGDIPRTKAIERVLEERMGIVNTGGMP
jgi:hypothetical protein